MPARRPRRSTDPNAFYAALLRRLKKTRIPFILGGTVAVNAYIGLERATKDLDVFCLAGDYPRLLKVLAERGYKTEVEDERWIAKVREGPHYCDIIFGSANMVAPVTSEWFKEARPATIMGSRVRLLPPTELVWSKSFIQDRYKFDGNDVAHLILVKHDEINWKRLLGYFEQHWEVLLMHVLRFRYIYPSERGRVPRWVFEELLGRLEAQRRLPLSRKRSCRGRVFSRDDFQIDIEEWGFADLVGDDWYTGPGKDERRKTDSVRLRLGLKKRNIRPAENGRGRGSGTGRG